MRRIPLGLITLVAALLVPVAARCQTTSQPMSAPPTSPDQANSSTDRLAGWRADLRLLAETLATKHKDAFTITSREKFDAAVAELDARLCGLTDRQVLLEFKRLVALVGDAHTNLADSKGRFNSPFYPFSVLLLGDGVFITAATPAHADLLGLRIVRVGATPVEEVIERLGAIIPHENDAWLRTQARMLLMSPDALTFVGVVDDPQQATFTLADSDGDESTVTLSPMQPDEQQRPDPRLGQSKLAFTLRQRGAGGGLIYGSIMVPNSRDLYVWYDACRNMENKSVSEFATETLGRISRDKPERIIIDLRRNSGGNSALIAPLVRGLAKRDSGGDGANPAAANLYVLIGSSTFSSGLWAAEDLKRQAHAILVGTPTGGKPNSFGEQRSVELPHSGLTLYYSTKKWVRDPDGDPDSLEPDVLVETTYADLVNGRDTALDAARSHHVD